MPVLESTEFTTPRSALRFRPIGGDEAQPDGHVEKVPPPLVQRASRSRSTDAQVEIDEWERAPGNAPSNTQAQSSTRRSNATIKPKTPSKTQPQKPAGTRRLPGSQRAIKNRAHPLFYLGLGMLGMLVLWMLLMSAASWFSTTMDDIRYGRPRTFQTDQFVGYNEAGGTPSHFIALNLNGHIEIIEFPGGDATHARIFLGPQLYATGSDLVPVTLTFMDVNGDHKVDMIINVQGSQVVFINDQGTFRPLRPDERHQVEQFLQRHGP
jgi:hypothetical protein